MATTAPELDTAAAVLDAVRSDRAVADAAEARILQAAVAWAAMHSVDSLDDAACDWYGDQPIPVAGPGAPLVAEFSIAEFAVALGLPVEVGKAYVGEALELRHRLPKTWARVLAGDLQAWRARWIAQRTTALSPEAAAHVDGAVAPFAHKIRLTALEHTVAVAIATYMPDQAETRQQAAVDHRRFGIDTRQTTLTGTAEVHGTLDLADALDLEAAVATTAATLKDLGSQDSLDVRRAVAVGEIARRQLALDLSGDPVVEEVAPQPSRNPRQPAADRAVVLNVHLSHAAIQGARGVGRLDNLNLPVLVQQIRSWCGGAAEITVNPIIDLNRCAPVDRHDPPKDTVEQVDQRDRHCVFPWCTRRAKKCDKDHVRPWRPGDQTCACNLAPLCRRHHRHKTHGRWRYLALKPGMFLWTSPHGYHYLVDEHGTDDVSPDRRARSRHGHSTTYTTNELRDATNEPAPTDGGHDPTDEEP